MWNELENVDMVDDIMEFHKTFCPDQIELFPQEPNNKIKLLRTRLIDEEVNTELLPALKSGNLVQIADGIADSIVVLIGTAIAYGIPLKEVWKAVHKSNMAKAQPDGTVLRREDGKILKPDDWKAPDIGKILYDKQLEFAGTD